MTLTFKKNDIASSASLAEALRSQIKDFPPYLHDNWDSIEASLCDYIEDLDNEFYIIHCFDKEWIRENCPVYASILSRLLSDYSKVRVEFQ